MSRSFCQQVYSRHFLKHYIPGTKHTWGWRWSPSHSFKISFPVPWLYVRQFCLLEIQFRRLHWNQISELLLDIIYCFSSGDEILGKFLIWLMCTNQGKTLVWVFKGCNTKRRMELRRGQVELRQQWKYYLWLIHSITSNVVIHPHLVQLNVVLSM